MLSYQKYQQYAYPFYPKKHNWCDFNREKLMGCWIVVPTDSEQIPNEIPHYAYMKS